MAASSVLFIRSVPVTAALPALRWLRRNMPGAAITALTSTGARAGLEATGLVDGYTNGDANRLSVSSVGLSRIHELSRQRFDLVVVPFVASRRTFWNVGRLALAIRGRKTVWIKCDGLPQDADPLAVLEPVTVTAWWREVRPSSRLRLAVLLALKWPALLIAYVAGMVLFALLAGMLLPFVWLMPEPGRLES